MEGGWTIDKPAKAGTARHSDLSSSTRASSNISFTTSFVINHINNTPPHDIPIRSPKNTHGIFIL
jgi:hypothetical protein